MPVSILCVDDEPTNLDILVRLLSNSVEQVYLAPGGQEGYDLFLEKRPDIVLTDLMMPIVDGLMMSRMIRAVTPDIPIILLTSCSSVNFLADAVDVGITQFLPKPVLKHKLLTSVRRCHGTQRLAKLMNTASPLRSPHLRPFAVCTPPFLFDSAGPTG